MPAHLTQNSSNEWATQQQCERDLGLSDWNRSEVFNHVVGRLAQPPFAQQPDNALRLKLWRQVQSLIPHHHVGPYQVGRLLAAQGQRAEARKWLDRAVTLRPEIGAGWLEL